MSATSRHRSAPNCRRQILSLTSTLSRCPPSSTSSHLSLQMYILSVLLFIITSLVSPSEAISCNMARMKCAYRIGCGNSLQSYMAECSSLIGGLTDRCTTKCENALIALASSEEGADLVTCDCEGSKYCEKSKQRIEVCRPAVDTAVAVDSIVSCTTAEWICMSDTLCRTALEYYHLYCRGLFHGRKCNSRCKNSLSILERQEKAAKLRTCYCDGTENYNCKRVKHNTERYCYSPMRRPNGSPDKTLDEDERPDNAIEVIGSSASTYHSNQHHSKQRHKHKHRLDAMADTSAARTATGPHQSAPLLLVLATALAIAANRCWHS